MLATLAAAIIEDLIFSPHMNLMPELKEAVAK